jgi:hypothetical protein
MQLSHSSGQRQSAFARAAAYSYSRSSFVRELPPEYSGGGPLPTYPPGRVSQNLKPYGLGLALIQ